MELFSDCECFEATARWAFMVKSKCYIVAFRNQEEFFKNHQTKDFNSSKSVKSKWLVERQSEWWKGNRKGKSVIGQKRNCGALGPPDGDAALSIQGRKSPVIGAPV